MKKIYIHHHFPSGKWRKAILIMKLKFVLILCCTGSLTAGSLYSQQSTYDVKVENKAIVSILNDLRVQTGRQFFYRKGLIPGDQRASVAVQNATLEEILDKVLAANGYVYEIQGDVVLISRSETPATRLAMKQQGGTVRGRVMSTDGSPLAGATVVIEGTSTGVVADHNGVFSLLSNAASGNLIVSFLGYERKIVPFAAGQSLDIALNQSATAITDVIVTGYNTIDKRQSASATSTYKMDELMIQGMNTVDKMLQGQVPGLMVVTRSGSPNATPRMRMRGSATIYGNAAPVWVIDGIIWEDPVNISNDELNNILQGTDVDFLNQANDNASLSLLGNAISGLNPNDIQSITFLKDASATAIYGTKAANGVIVITTKRGEIGRPRVSFNSSFGFTARPRYEDYQLMNSKERIGVSKDVVEGNYLYESMPFRTSYEGALLDLYDNIITKAEFDSRVAGLEVMNTDWFDLLFQNAFSQDYTASVSGGTTTNRYYVSLNYGDSKGSSKGDEMMRYGLNMNMSTRFGNAIDVDWRINYSHRKSEGYYMVNPLDYALKTSRAISPDEYYVTGLSTMVDLPTNYPLSYNIFNELDNTGNTVLARTVNASVVLNARILGGLTFQGTFGANYSNTRNDKWAGERSYYIGTIRGYDYGTVKPRGAEELASVLPKGGILIYSNTDQTSYTARGQFNYGRVFNYWHTLNASAGFEMRSVEYKGFETHEYGYYPDRGQNISYEYDGTTAGANWPYGKWSSLNKHTAKNVNTVSNAVSVYATVVYGYKNRYIFNANVRSDASNRFGQYINNRFQPVWSLAGRWSMSQEEWLRDNRFIDDLSFRVSLGLQGSVPTSVGPNLIVKYPSTVTNRFTGDYILNVSRYPYPDLRWEKSKSWNFGFDFSLFDNKISGTIDYYVKNTRDVIFSLDVPAEYGVNSIYRNGADVKNTGIEIALSFTPVRTENWRWTVSTNWSKNTNNVDNTGDQTYTYKDYLSGNAFVDGKAVTGLYAWEFTGLDHDSGIAVYNHTAKWGETVEKSADPAAYLKYCGQRDPKMNGGFSTTVQYRRVSVSGQFAFAFGHVRRLNFLYNGALKMPLPHDNLSTELLDRWKNPGDEEHTDIPGFVYTGNTADYTLETPAGQLNSYEMYNYSTARVIKGDFFRCRNLSLSYYFTPQQLRPLGLEAVTCSFNVTNPFTIANKKLNGQDPEMESTGGTALPITRSYTLSVNINF